MDHGKGKASNEDDIEDKILKKGFFWYFTYKLGELINRILFSHGFFVTIIAIITAILCYQVKDSNRTNMNFFDKQGKITENQCENYEKKNSSININETVIYINKELGATKNNGQKRNTSNRSKNKQPQCYTVK